MLFPINNIEEIEQLNELVLLQNQVIEVRLQDKLGKLTFHKDMRRVSVPATKSLENTSQDIIGTITESPKKTPKQ